MAKRRKRYKEKKNHKRDKHARRRKKYEEKKHEKDMPSTMERRPSKLNEGKRKDTSVIIVAIICIISVISGYLIYNYYDDIFNPQSESNGESINIKPNPQPNNNNNGNNNGNDNTDIPEFEPLYPSNPIIIVEVKDYGVIVIELYDHMGEIHITVSNFLEYVRARFYDNLIFHRVMDTFVIQTGGFDKDLNQKQPIFPSIPLEIADELLHLDGAVAMARTTEPNSATSQFYICDGRNSQQESLDGNYAVFGQVIAGMNVVREISGVSVHTEKGYENVPVDDVVINRIYEYTGPIA